MNIITTCIGDLPEELREATVDKQRERRKNGNIYYPFLSDEYVESLKDEVMLTIWPMEHGFIFTMEGSREFVEVASEECPLSTERAKWYLEHMQPWTKEVEDMWFETVAD
ncbi:MAG: hypothetical protein ACI3X8_05380 [Alloprevotella sp.]